VSPVMISKPIEHNPEFKPIALEIRHDSDARDSELSQT
jgi:hypothetical protein